MARMRILTPDGVKEIEVSDPKDASTLGSYWNAVRRLLNTGDVQALLDFEGASVAGQPLEVDPDVIEELGFRDELDFDDIYESRDSDSGDPLRDQLRRQRRRMRLDPDAVCVFCLEPDLEVLAPRRLRRHLLEGHHALLARNDAELELTLCLNCHAKAHAGLLTAGVDPRAHQSSFLDRLTATLRALGSFFGQLAASIGGWADRLEALIGALDARLPNWRELQEVTW